MGGQTPYIEKIILIFFIHKSTISILIHTKIQGIFYRFSAAVQIKAHCSRINIGLINVTFLLGYGPSREGRLSALSGGIPW